MGLLLKKKNHEKGAWVMKPAWLPTQYWNRHFRLPKTTGKMVSWQISQDIQFIWQHSNEK
jgi:hypothetical protein